MGEGCVALRCCCDGWHRCDCCCLQEFVAFAIAAVATAHAGTAGAAAAGTAGAAAGRCCTDLESNVLDCRLEPFRAVAAAQVRLGHHKGVDRIECCVEDDHSSTSVGAVGGIGEFRAEDAHGAERLHEGDGDGDEVWIGLHHDKQPRSRGLRTSDVPQADAEDSKKPAGAHTNNREHPTAFVEKYFEAEAATQ